MFYLNLKCEENSQEYNAYVSQHGCMYSYTYYIWIYGVSYRVILETFFLRGRYKLLIVFTLAARWPFLSAVTLPQVFTAMLLVTVYTLYRLVHRPLGEPITIMVSMNWGIRTWILAVLFTLLYLFGFFLRVFMERSFSIINLNWRKW